MSDLNFPTLDAAIANIEGYNIGGTIARTQNNPGNLVYNDYTKSLGATSKGYNGLAVFPDADTGMKAEDSFLTVLANKGQTIDDISKTWAPAAAPGNTPATPGNWAQQVASYLGVKTDTDISSLKTGTQGPSTDATTTPASSVTGAPSTTSKITGVLGDAANLALSSGVAGPLGMLASGTLFGLPISRIGAFLLALIVIAGAIFLFKPVQEVVKSGVKKGVALAAV